MYAAYGIRIQHMNKHDLLLGRLTREELKALHALVVKARREAGRYSIGTRAAKSETPQATA
jgi:hypothetical protein